MPVQKSQSVSSLSTKSVVDLRKMAKKMGVKQTTASGHTKNKSQLVKSLAKK